MKQVRIAELKSKLSEYLRAVQNGESLCVLDRNTAIAQIVPLPTGRRLKIRRPAAGAPTLASVSLPGCPVSRVDAVDRTDAVVLLMEERQNHR